MMKTQHKGKIELKCFELKPADICIANNWISLNNLERHGSHLWQYKVRQCLLTILEVSIEDSDHTTAGTSLIGFVYILYFIID